MPHRKPAPVIEEDTTDNSEDDEVVEKYITASEPKVSIVNRVEKAHINVLTKLLEKYDQI